MPRYLISTRGEPFWIEADEYQGWLVEPDTTMPIIDPVLLDRHPDKETLLALLQKGRKAADTIHRIVERKRREDKKLTGAKRHPESVEARVTRHRENRYELFDVKHTPQRGFAEGREAAIEAIWNQAAFRKLMIPAPAPGYVYEKLVAQDFDFNPAQLEDLRRRPQNFVRIGRSDIALLFYFTDPFSKHWESHNPFIDPFVALVNADNPHGALDMLEQPFTRHLARSTLRHEGYESLRHAVAAGKEDIALRILNLLPETMVQYIGTQETYKTFRRACAYGMESLIKEMLRQISESEYWMLKEDNFLNIPSRNGHTGVVKELLEFSASYKVKTKVDYYSPEALIRAYESACYGGHVETASLLHSALNESSRELLKTEPGKEVSRPDVPAAFEALRLTPQDFRKYKINPDYLNNDYLHPGASREVYDALVPLVAPLCDFEGNHDPQHIAYRLALLFDAPERAIAFLKSMADATPKGGSMLETLTRAAELPSSNDWSVPAWRGFIARYGEAALTLLSKAAEIENAFQFKAERLREDEKYEWVFDRLTLGQLQVFAGMTSPYKEQYLYPEVAELYDRLKVSPHAFTATVKVLQEREANIAANNGIEGDNIPDIDVIDGAAFGHPKYYMVKLAKPDVRALVLGRYYVLSCCNSIDGNTHRLAKAHMLSPDAGAYVIMRKSNGETKPASDPIVAKTSILRGSQEGEILFNSWERNDEARELCVPFFHEAAKRVLKADPSIQRIQMGKSVTGGITSQEWSGFDVVSKDDLIVPKNVDCITGDSMQTQYLVLSREQAKILYPEEFASVSKTMPVFRKSEAAKAANWADSIQKSEDPDIIRNH